MLNSGTISVTGAVSALITGLGSQAQQINTAQTAQTAVNTQALSSVQSITGVNLDEEAANLLQWQQAYQAAAQALAIGNSLFTTLDQRSESAYRSYADAHHTSSRSDAVPAPRSATLESNLSQTQNQISTNQSFTTASQNPIGGRRGEQLQPGPGAEPAIRHQRRQRADAI